MSCEDCGDDMDRGSRWNELCYDQSHGLDSRLSKEHIKSNQQLEKLVDEKVHRYLLK